MSVAPRWACLLGWFAFAVTVPSALWRVAMIVGVVPGTSELRSFELGDDPLAGHVYVFALSVIQLSASFLTVGLSRRWGERWGRRNVPMWPVVAVATVGALTVTWLFTVSLPLALATGHRPDSGHVHGGALALMVGCYAPIVAWGPSTLVSVGEYAVRRRRGRTVRRAATLTA